jgi:hypothetical protein
MSHPLDPSVDAGSFRNMHSVLALENNDDEAGTFWMSLASYPYASNHHPHHALSYTAVLR